MISLIKLLDYWPIPDSWATKYRVPLVYNFVVVSRMVMLMPVLFPWTFSKTTLRVLEVLIQSAYCISNHFQTITNIQPINCTWGIGAIRKTSARADFKNMFARKFLRKFLFTPLVQNWIFCYQIWNRKPYIKRFGRIQTSFSFLSSTSIDSNNCLRAFYNSDIYRKCYLKYCSFVFWWQVFHAMPACLGWYSPQFKISDSNQNRIILEEMNVSWLVKA